MKLDEDSNSAITEIGNLCIAGGSNRISTFSDTLVDISVVEAKIRETLELVIEIDPYDDCKRLIGQKVKGDFTGEFLVSISNQVIETIITKFNNIEHLGEFENSTDAIDKLMSEFILGCVDGIAGMTGLDLQADGGVTLCEELDLETLPKQVLSYQSIIFIGDDRLDFNVYFFADPVTVVPKILEALGM